MDAPLLAQLRQLQLHLKPAKASSMLGHHELRHRGRSLEFAGYREYRPGDDLRELDWKLLARTERHYIKQRDTHSPATVLVLVDTSATMQLQSPVAEFSKLRVAQLLAFGLIYTLHRQGDRFSLQQLDGEPVARPRSSKRAFLHALQQLERPPSATRAEFPNLSAQSYDQIYLLSDLLRPEQEWQPWLSQLRLAGRHCQILRVLDPLELGQGDEPNFLLDLTQPGYQRQMQSVDWIGYRTNFEQHRQRLTQYCRRQNLPLQECLTQAPIYPRIREVLLRL